MKLTREVAILSTMVGEDVPPEDTATHSYEAFGFSDDESDQALLAKTTDGYCLVSFRGTEISVEDWSQNLAISEVDVCADTVTTGTEQSCCTTREGFYDAYNTYYRTELELSIRNCASLCLNPDDCVVLAGHSRGGSVALLAAIVLADINPIVITFGQAPTVITPCPLLTSDRIYRYINTEQNELLGITYDPIPMTPRLGMSHVGNMIVLSIDDKTGVAFMGLDSDHSFNPLLLGVNSHYMMSSETRDTPGYADNIEALMGPTAIYPIRNNVSAFLHWTSLNITSLLI
jgi:hypothetical protein